MPASSKPVLTERRTRSGPKKRYVHYVWSVWGYTERTLKGWVLLSWNFFLEQVREDDNPGQCLVILYDTVYDLQDFAQIHRGGAWSILRNCGKDATKGYEALQCIKDVPDHSVGILNMVADSIVGVIADGAADGCPITATDYEVPNFDECDVYNRLTCERLESMPNEGKWTVEQVEAATDRRCLVALYDYVYELDAPPVGGGLTFANKHGGGRDAIVNHCNEDITGIFETLIKTSGVPDHTKGSMNAIIGYLAGVIDGSDADPCVNPPPEPNCDQDELTYFTMNEVRALMGGCVAVVWGKVYLLDEFATYHFGGRDEILEHCGEDMTNEFFEKPFHTIVHLGAIQNFQIGVIEDSIADPCSNNYIQDPDRPPAEEPSEDSEDGSERKKKRALRMSYI